MALIFHCKSINYQRATKLREISPFIFKRVMGLLPDTYNCGLRMRRECQERFLCHRGLAIPTCTMARVWCTCRDACRDHGTWVMHVPWCMPGSFTIGSFLGRWRRKRYRHSRCMPNPQFFISGKRPIQQVNKMSHEIIDSQRNLQPNILLIAKLKGRHMIMFVYLKHQVLYKH